MAIFPALPCMIPGPMVGGERTYDLLEELVMPDGWIVRTGFRTDGASIPKPAQPIIGAHDGPFFPAAIGHDDRYQRSQQTRREVDLLFLSDMRACGVGFFRRHAMYRAVRIGAGPAWRKYHRGMEQGGITGFGRKRRRWRKRR